MGFAQRRPGESSGRDGDFRKRTEAKAGAMADLLSFAILVCVSAGSMGFGILAAYGVLRVGLALMRPQARRDAVKPQVEAARAS